MQYLKKHTRGMIVAIALIIVISIGAAVVRNRGGAEEAPVRQTMVSVVAASDLGHTNGTISAEGTLESLEQAELRSQLSAPVTKVSVRIGDRVAVGAPLVTLQGRDILAQLEQAKAGLKAQEARLRELQKGARPEDISITQTDLAKAQSDLASAYGNLPTVLNDVYAKADNAVRKQTDAMFDQDESSTPELTFHLKDLQAEIDLERARASVTGELQAMRGDFDAVRSGIAPAQAESVLAGAKGRLTVISAFLNRMSDALRLQYDLSGATVDLYRQNIAAARAEVSGASATVTAQEQAIVAQAAAVKRIQDQLALKQAGATGEQLETQEAAVDQAKANVAQLQAQYAKTVIAAPIGGTIAAVSVRVGELLTPGQAVVSIVNKEGLQVKLFVSELDVQFIEEGAEATIGDGIKGRVLRISPSVDKSTRKVEVTVLVVDKAPTLVIGQNVSVSIAVRQLAGGTGVYLVPVQAMRVAGGVMYVYTVNADNVVEEHRVVTGRILGEVVEVVDGLHSDMRIISMAQAVRAGQTVVVK